MSRFWYLGTPYSKFRLGLEAAFLAACDARADLVRAGIPCFSPIVHSHPVAIHGKIDPLSHAIWLPAEQPIMRCATGLIVRMLEGWEDSYGLGEEIKDFERHRKPVVMWPLHEPAEALKVRLAL